MSNNTKQLIILGCLVFLGLAAVLLRCTGAPAPVPKRPVDTLAIHAAHLEAQAWKDSATSYKTRLDTSSDSVVVEEADHWYAVHDTLPVHDTVRRNDTVKLLEAVLADDSVCRAEGEGLRLVIGSTQDQLLAASQGASQRLPECHRSLRSSANRRWRRQFATCYSAFRFSGKESGF